MATPITGVRIPPALKAAIEAHAARERQTVTDAILEALADRFMGHDSAPAPRTKAPVPADARQALAQTERRVGVTPARLDTSLVPVYDGSKRPAYQKGQAGQGKGKR